MSNFNIPTDCRAVLAVRDRKSGTFNTINLSTCIDADGVNFVRSLAIMRQSGDQSPLALFPADFELVCFGYITYEGKLIPNDNYEVVACGSDALALCPAD